MHRLCFLLLISLSIQAQWLIQQSNTSADLRGIHSLGQGTCLGFRHPRAPSSTPQTAAGTGSTAPPTRR